MVVVFISAHLERNNNNPRTRTMTRFPFSFLQCIHLFGWWIQVDEHYMFDLFPWFFSFEVDRVRETRRSELVTGSGQCNPSYIPSGRRHHGVAIEKERKTVQTALLVVYVAIHILFIDFLGYRVCFRLPFFLENFYDRGHFEMKTRVKMSLRLFCSIVLRPCPNLIYISRLINSVNV